MPLFPHRSPFAKASTFIQNGVTARLLGCYIGKRWHSNEPARREKKKHLRSDLKSQVANNCIPLHRFPRGFSRKCVLELTFSLLCISLCQSHQVAAWVSGWRRDKEHQAHVESHQSHGITRELRTRLQEPKWALRGRISVTLRDEILFIMAPAPTYCASAIWETDDPNEGQLLVPTTKHAHCSHCITRSLLPYESKTPLITQTKTNTDSHGHSGTNWHRAKLKSLHVYSWRTKCKKKK